MAIIRSLADSSFIYAIYDTTDQKHSLTRNILNSNQIQIIIPDVVLVEVLYLLKARIGTHAVIRCLDSLIAAQIPLEPIVVEDLRRIREINVNYETAHFDFVDCCLMALAE